MTIRGLRIFCLAGLLMACSSQQDCLLIGCFDGLSVAFKGQLPAAFSVKLKATGQSDLELACPGGSSQYVCLPDSVFVSRYTPESVEVTYTAGDKTQTQTLKPTYTTSRPNGAACAPECRQGKVELTL